MPVISLEGFCSDLYSMGCLSRDLYSMGCLSRELFVDFLHVQIVHHFIEGKRKSEVLIDIAQWVE